MPINNLFYILQLENYDIIRFIKFSYQKLNWLKTPRRKKLVFTNKIKLLYTLSILILGYLLFLTIFFQLTWLIKIIILIALYLLLPIIIVLTDIAVMPLEIFLKNNRIKLAKQKINKSPATVIGITGSYGKTSSKEILFAIFNKNFKTIKTPDSINTDIGISDFLIKEDISQTDILIIEMGAHKIGEIAKICDIVKPVYSITCGINESHLERFGSLKNIIRTKFELAERTAKIAWLNIEDQNIEKNYQLFKIKDARKISKQKIAYEVLDNFKGLKFNYKNIDFSTKLLAEHSITQLMMAIDLAEEMGMSLSDIKNRVQGIETVEHRLQPIYSHQTGIMVIDDSYNGNFDGFKSGIDVLNRAQGRKIVLTPGIIELGAMSSSIHSEIANIYIKNIDLALLINNTATAYIVKIFLEQGFKNYKCYDSASEAHKDLPNILLKNDTIIFQNDWPDNL